MKSQSRKTFFYLTQSALFAALIYIVTCYVKLPTLNGYVHVGDALIFLASSLLPAPYAIAASAIGGSLGDILGGYFIWVPATAVIKAATAACFSSKKEKIICKRNAIALVFALVFCVGGYYLFEATVIEHNFISPLAAVVPNIFQIVASAVLYITFGILLDSRPTLKKLLKDTKDTL